MFGRAKSEDFYLKTLIFMLFYGILYLLESSVTARTGHHTLYILIQQFALKYMSFLMSFPLASDVQEDVRTFPMYQRLRKINPYAYYSLNT